MKKLLDHYLEKCYYVHRVGIPVEYHSYILQAMKQWGYQIGGRLYVLGVITGAMLAFTVAKLLA